MKISKSRRGLTRKEDEEDEDEEEEEERLKGAAEEYDVEVCDGLFSRMLVR